MYWKVSYRSKNGKIKSEMHEAASREELFLNLTDLNISPVRVERCDDSFRKSPILNSFSARLVFATLGIAVVCCLTIWLFIPFNPPEKEKPAQEKQHKGIIEAHTAAVVSSSCQVNEPKEEPVKTIDPEMIKRRERFFKMSPEEKIDFIFEQAKKRELDLEPTTNRPFRTGTEIQLARIFSTEVGAMPPPLFPTPIQDEAHLAEILIAANPVLEGDSERIKEAKEMVELAKEELKTYIREGGDITTFLEYYHGKLVEAHQEWTMASKEVARVAREEPEIALEFIDRINERLESKGIRPVHLSQKTKQQLGLE